MPPPSEHTSAAPSATGLALVRLSQGSASLLGLWDALVWGAYLEADAPYGRTEAACRRWWDDTLAEADAE